MSFAKFVLTACLLVTMALHSEGGIVVPTAPSSLPFKHLGTMKLKHAAFITIGNIDNKKSLIITDFSGNPLAKDGVSVVPDIGSKLTTLSAVKPTKIASPTWPNEASMIPKGVINGLDADVVASPGGFLVPGKSNGAITLVVLNKDGTAKQQVVVSNKKGGFFYHVVEWVDMNNDGRMDILTARATKPIFRGETMGELLWLEQPDGASAALAGPWKEHVLMSGNDVAGATTLDGTSKGLSSPDIFFELADLNGDNQKELVASVFFQEKLTIFFQGEGSSQWTDIKGIVIDSTIGPVFASEVVDVNGDGHLDIVATNHVNEAGLSGVYAYENRGGNPRDPANWVKHTLASGFETLKKGKGQASPGRAYSFYPKTSEQTGKPNFVMATDGNLAAYALLPNSADVNDWTYTLQKIGDYGAVVGQIAVDDVDGDGYVEMFVPIYDNGLIEVYTLKP